MQKGRFCPWAAAAARAAEHSHHPGSGDAVVRRVGGSRAGTDGSGGHTVSPARAEAVGAGQRRKVTMFLPSAHEQVIHVCRFISAVTFHA